MNKKILGIFIVMLLIGTAIPCFGIMNEQKSINEPSVLLHETVTIRHHLLKRNYLIYVPTSYDEKNPLSLVVVFHGGQNTPENASERFGISEKAEEECFIVVYPDASDFMYNTWNIGFGWYTKNLIRDFLRFWVDEVGFTRKIIEKTQNDYNINPDRIYLSGHSNGAMMAYYFGVLHSDIIAAIASNGGCIGGNVKDHDMVNIPEPVNPMSIAIFHGELDQIVPYDGGWNSKESFYCTSVAEAVSFWGEQNGCNTEPETNNVGNVTIDKYSGGEGGTEILVYTIHNKGHIWFGGPAWEDPNPEISTTDEMWEFFESHPKQ